MKLWTGKLSNHTIPGRDISFLFLSIQTGLGAPDCLLFALSPGGKPCPNAGLSTTNSTRTGLRGNTGLHSDGQVTDCPSYGRALSIVTLPLPHGHSSVIQEIDYQPTRGHISTEIVWPPPWEYKIKSLCCISFCQITLLNWIGNVNRMGNKRKVSQVFNHNPQGSWLREWSKSGGRTVYKQILINAKLKAEKRGQQRELTWRSPLRRWRCALDCSAI